MLYGKVLHPPSFGATLVSLDSSAAEAMPGVKVVRDGDFVGVTAPDPATADKALAALKAEWKPVAGRSLQPGCLRLFQARPRRDAPPPSPSLTAYTVAYIAHAPLEPRAAVAEWERRQAHRLDRHAASLRRAQRTGRTLQAARRPRARDHARYRLGLRRQAHRRRGDGSGAAGEGRRQAGEAQLDARRGNDLGLLPPRRRDRSRRQGQPRRHASPTGNSTTTIPAPRRCRRPTTCRANEGAASSSASRRCGRARTAAWRRTANHFVRESYMDELAHSIEHGPAGIPPEERARTSGCAT